MFPRANPFTAGRTLTRSPHNSPTPKTQNTQIHRPKPLEAATTKSNESENPSKRTRCEEDTMDRTSYEAWKNLSEEERQYRMFMNIEELKISNRTREQETQNLNSRMMALEKENEMLKREILSSSIRIIGMKEEENESFKKTEEKVEKLFTDLGLAQLSGKDCKEIKRIGQKSEKPRPIIVNFIRKNDKIECLKATKKLMGKQEYRTTYINPEKTKMQIGIDKKLRDTAKGWKNINPHLKTRVRGGTLLVIDGTESRNYKVNEDGQVEQI